MLDLKTPLYICTLAETENFQEASKRLFISQPTLSIAIKKIEEQIGEQLFIRTGKYVKPTYIGTIVIEKCRNILKEEENLKQELSKYHRGITGGFRIGTFLRLSPFIMPPVISDFMKKYPQIELQLSEMTVEQLFHSLDNRELDLIICTQSKPLKQFEYIPLIKDHILAVLPQSHPAIAYAKQIPGYNYPYLDLNMLKNELFILQRPEQMIRKLAEATFKYVGIQPQNSIVISNIETAAQLSAKGNGISFCMESYVKTIRTNKPVFFCMVGDVENNCELGAFYSSHLKENESFQYLLELVIKYIHILIE